MVDYVLSLSDLVFVSAGTRSLLNSTSLVMLSLRACSIPAYLMNMSVTPKRFSESTKKNEIVRTLYAFTSSENFLSVVATYSFTILHFRTLVDSRISY